MGLSVQSHLRVSINKYNWEEEQVVALRTRCTLASAPSSRSLFTTDNLYSVVSTPQRCSPQGSSLGPLLTNQIPFAGDKASLASDLVPNIAAAKLKCKKWYIKLNGTECVHTAFALGRKSYTNVVLNNVPTSNSISRLWCHVLNIRFELLY